MTDITVSTVDFRNAVLATRPHGTSARRAGLW